MKTLINGSRRARLAAGFAAVALATASIVGTARAETPGGPDLGGKLLDYADPPEGDSNFIPSPFLSDNDVAEVDAFLANQQATGGPLAVKINTPLNTAAAIALFDKYNISYVFLDFEDPNAVSETRQLADLVHNSAKSGSAFVGNFNLYPVTPDPTSTNGGISASYQFSRVNMANEQLYPGHADFINAWLLPSSNSLSTPNIRSALFILPIQRLSQVTQNLPAGHANIPWVSRFNNNGNSALDTDGNPSNGYQFVQNATDPTQGQLPSRGDFSAQILHYRLRGATAVNLLNFVGGTPTSSVVGYTNDQMRADALAGWNGSQLVNDIFSRGHWALANLGTTVLADPFIERSSENTGTIWSGVYDTTGTQRFLAVLLSNLGDQPQEIDVGMATAQGIHAAVTIGGIPVFDPASTTNHQDDFDIAPGTHRLLQFTLQNNRWVLFSNTEVFTDHNRNGVGVPEPTSLALLGLGGIGLLARRRRTA